MSTFTGRIVAGLRADLAREGHTGIVVPDEPTVEDLAQACGTLLVPVADFVQRIEQDDCPSWCEWHSLDVVTAELVHRRAVTVGRAEVSLEYAPADSPGVAVILPEWPEATAESARDLAAAITETLGLLDADETKGVSRVHTPEGSASSPDPEEGLRNAETPGVPSFRRIGSSSDTPGVGK